MQFLGGVHALEPALVFGRLMLCECLPAARGQGDAIFGANDCADLMSSHSCFLLLLLNWARAGSGDWLSVMSCCAITALTAGHQGSICLVFASSSIFILFWHNVGIPKNVSLLLLGEMDGANRAAECGEGIVSLLPFHSVLLPCKIIDT